MSVPPRTPVHSSENLNIDDVSGRPHPSSSILNLLSRSNPEAEDVHMSEEEQGNFSGEEGDNEYEEDGLGEKELDFGGELRIFTAVEDDTESDVVEIPREKVVVRPRKATKKNKGKKKIVREESTEDEECSSTSEDSSEPGPPKKKRKVVKPVVRKGPNGRQIVGGQPSSGYQLGDAVEPEHEGSSDEEYELYIAKEAE